MPTFAAVDIGSNSVRLKIARLQAGRLRALHEDREVTRLGEGVFGSGFLTPDSIAETVKVLRRFHRATQQIVTDSVRVVATSALRDARNSQAFLEWVRSATGWRVEIISGVEEARLIHLGLVSSGRVDRSPTLMMDLGGGSCELTVSQGGHIRDAVSLPLGAVRLTNEFLRHDPTRKGELKRLRGFVTREVNRIIDRIATAKVKNVIATSGTAAALVAVASHLRHGASRQRLVVSCAEMTRIAKRLARLPVAERRQILRLPGTAGPAPPQRLPLFAARLARRNPRPDGRRLRSQHALRQASRIRTVGIHHERGRPLPCRPQARPGCPRRRYLVVLGAAVAAPPAARIPRVALGGGHALRSGRLRESERPPPSYPLHHFQLRDFGLHASTAPYYCGNCPLSGKITPRPGGWSHEAVGPGRSSQRAEGNSVASSGACPEPGTQPRRGKSTCRRALWGSEIDAGPSASNGSGSGALGD